jgi:multidrug efflux system membrane fusion protein
MVDSLSAHTETAYQRAEDPHARVRRGSLALRLVLMALVLTLVVGGLYGFNKFREKAIASFFANNKPPPTVVVLSEAKAEDVPKFLTGIGTLVAVHQVTIAPEVGGRIVQILFQPGTSVKTGDLLVQLNDKPDEGDLLNYRAQARLAELNLKRSRELVGRQFTPQSTVDQNQASLDQANAGIAKTQAVINQKLIRAPFDGDLGVRQVEVGQYLDAGGAIVTLTDLNTLFVNFTLPEQTRAQLKVGLPVRVTVDAFPGRVFEGQLSTVEPQISSDTRNIKVQATLSNPDKALLPGMFANTRVVLAPQPGVLTVPETAVDYTLYGDSVFVVREDGKDDAGNPVLKATRTFVRTADRFNNKVAIASGLKPGDKIVTSGQLKLQSGAVVTPSSDAALAAPAVPTN